MTTQIFLCFSILFYSCHSLPTQISDSKTANLEQNDSASSSKATRKEDRSSRLLQHHLKDTTVIKGNFVLFLRPDSTRFEDYANEDENIYDADSDFGFGISTTMDSISRNKRYHNIHTAVSDNRYIVIHNCKNCPQTIDRDTIGHGLVLTSKGKDIKVQINLHSGHYLQDIDEYFNVNGRKD